MFQLINGSALCVTRYFWNLFFDCFFSNINSTTDFYIFSRIGGYQDFSSKLSLSHGTKKNAEEHFGVSKSFGYRKSFCIGRGYHYSPSNFFCLTVPLEFVEEPLCVSKKIRYQNFNELEGASRFCWIFSVSKHRNEKLRKGFLLYFRKILLWKLLMHKKAVYRFSLVLIKMKNVSAGWDSNP